MGATAAMGVVAMGTAASAYGKLRAGADTKKIYDLNASVAERQAQDAEHHLVLLRPLGPLMLEVTRH